MIDRRIGKIKLRRGTDLQRKNVILEEGEFVYTFDKQRLFIGDGQTIGGILVSSRNFITNSYGIPQKAEYGDIVHDQSAGKTYIVGRDISNNLTLILIADADCCRKLQLRVDDLMTRLRALSSCLLPDEGTGTIDEGDDGTGVTVDQPTIENTSTIAWAINISSPPPVVLGQSITFTASAVGVGNITYKWNKLGVGDLPGKTLNYLTIGSITNSDLGSYRCIATSDVAGSIISNTATIIKATTPLVFVIQPTAPATVAYGTNFTATASAVGDGTISYRWYKDGTGYLGTQNTNVLTLNNLQVEDLGTYYCVARSTNTQTATSYAINLNVTTVGLHWTTGNWGDITKDYAESVTMSAYAAGDGVISYSWKKIFPTVGIIAGENFPTYTITSLTQAETGSYVAIATSTLGGSITSTEFYIRMNPPAVDVLSDGTYLISDPSGNYIKGEDDSYIQWNDSYTVSINQIQIAVSDYVSYFLGVDGKLSACGLNNNGQIGDATFSVKFKPFELNLPPVVNVATCVTHSLFLGVDGTVSACGLNDFGQLGDGTTTNKSTPVKINIPPVASFAAGDYYSFFLGVDGTLSACGLNSNGQLGDGTTTNRSIPVKINIPPVTDVAAGATHSLFLGVDGTVSACGLNSNGQLGDGTTTNRSTPVKINLPLVDGIAAGDYASFFLGVDGTVSACGFNDFGQLGDGTTTNRSTPVKINIPPVASLDAGGSTLLLLGVDGTVSACGLNDNGQLGDGTTTNRSTPVKINLPPVASFAAAATHSLFLGVDGTLSACGLNNGGQLGDGTKISKLTPVKIK